MPFFVLTSMILSWKKLKIFTFKTLRSENFEYISQNPPQNSFIKIVVDDFTSWIIVDSSISCSLRYDHDGISVSFLLPVFVLDDSVHDLLHLLGQGGRVGGELLSGRSASLPLPLAVLVFVSSSSSPRGRGGPWEVQVAVSLPLAGGLLVAHLLLHLLQRALLYGLLR